MSASPTKSADDSAGNADSQKPKGLWGTILTMTPVILTILATVFAGLSSSEMTRSMYYRSLAAQNQSKAGDQWAFFQAKRIRGTSMEMTGELMQSLAHPDPFELASVESVSGQMLQLLEKAGSQPGIPEAAAKVRKAREKLAKLTADDKFKQQISVLAGAALPKIEDAPLKDSLAVMVQAIGQRRTESETNAHIRKLQPDEIDEAMQLAEHNADAFDKACQPITDAAKHLGEVLKELNAAIKPLRKPSSTSAGNDASLAQVAALLDALNTGFRAAQLDFDARRYRQESAYNRKTAELLEVQVRHSGYQSDRLRERSKKFFYSMLVAQAGVTVASLALAKARHSILWALAAIAGVSALAFTGYVYFAP